MERKERFLRTKDVIEKVRLSRATIWRLESEGLFPQRRRIGPHAVAWLESEVEGLRLAFCGALPFPHIVVEEFLYPKAAEQLLSGYPAIGETEWDNNTTYKHQAGKYVKQNITGTDLEPFFEESNLKLYKLTLLKTRFY